MRGKEENSLAIKHPFAHNFGYMTKKLSRDVDALVMEENERLWNEEWERETRSALKNSTSRL